MKLKAIFYIKFLLSPLYLFFWWRYIFHEFLFSLSACKVLLYDNEWVCKWFVDIFFLFLCVLRMCIGNGLLLGMKSFLWECTDGYWFDGITAEYDKIFMDEKQIIFFLGNLLYELFPPTISCELCAIGRKRHVLKQPHTNLVDWI